MGDIPRVLITRCHDSPHAVLIDGDWREWYEYHEGEPDTLIAAKKEIKERIWPKYEGFMLNDRTLDTMNAEVQSILWNWKRQGALYQDLDGKWRLDRRHFPNFVLP